MRRGRYSGHARYRLCIPVDLGGGGAWVSHGKLRDGRLETLSKLLPVTVARPHTYFKLARLAADAHPPYDILPATDLGVNANTPRGGASVRQLLSLPEFGE